MNPLDCQMRRATIEDLDRLRSLWTQAALPVETLVKSLTEFQVAQAPDGTLLACIGLHLEGQHGKIHSACYRGPEIRVALEQPLWDRVQSVARNHGLWRLWIQDQSPVWRAHGFQEVEESVLQKLPPHFGPSHGSWLSLKLRDEIPPTISVEREFEMFRQLQQDWTLKAARQAIVLKVLAFLIAVTLLGFAGWMLWHIMRRLPILTN